MRVYGQPVGRAAPAGDLPATAPRSRRRALRRRRRLATRRQLGVPGGQARRGPARARRCSAWPPTTWAGGRSPSAPPPCGAAARPRRACRWVSANARAITDGQADRRTPAGSSRLAGRRDRCWSASARRGTPRADVRLVTDPTTSHRRGRRGDRRGAVSMRWSCWPTCPEDELAALAASLPEADAVVGGPTGQPIVPRLVGPTVLAAATSKGKFAVRLQDARRRAVVGSGGRAGPVVRRRRRRRWDNLHACSWQCMRTRDLSPPPTPAWPPATPAAAAPADYRIAGSASCLVLPRRRRATVWHASHHATGPGTHAGRQGVGGRPVLPTVPHDRVRPARRVRPPRRAGRRRGCRSRVVGCESCHGPSLAHVRDVHVRTPFAAFDQCVRCHDHENSPSFDGPTYWARVRHGKGQGPTTGPVAEADP